MEKPVFEQLLYDRAHEKLRLELYGFASRIPEQVEHKLIHDKPLQVIWNGSEYNIVSLLHSTKFINAYIDGNIEDEIQSDIKKILKNIDRIDLKKLDSDEESDD